MGWLKLGKLAIDVENWVMEVGTPDFVNFELWFVSKNHQQSDWILDSLVAEIISFLTMCPCSVYLWLLFSYGRLNEFMQLKLGHFPLHKQQNWMELVCSIAFPCYWEVETHTAQ